MGDDENVPKETGRQGRVDDLSVLVPVRRDGKRDNSAEDVPSEGRETLAEILRAWASYEPQDDDEDAERSSSSGTGKESDREREEVSMDEQQESAAPVDKEIDHHAQEDTKNEIEAVPEKKSDDNQKGALKSKEKKKPVQALESFPEDEEDLEQQD
eukprot:749586-Hanusia_phi.AAC.6